MSEEPHLLTEVVENILIATFNRPEKLNAMSSEMVDLIEQAVHRFRDTPELKVMLFKSKGRYFSAGADLKQGDGGERDEGEAADHGRFRLGVGGGVVSLFLCLHLSLFQRCDELNAIVDLCLQRQHEFVGFLILQFALILYRHQLCLVESKRCVRGG